MAMGSSSLNLEGLPVEKTEGLQRLGMQEVALEAARAEIRIKKEKCAELKLRN